MPILTESQKAELQNTYAKAATEWGAFRKWLSAHPLTGFWSGVAIGAVAGGLILWKVIL